MPRRPTLVAELCQNHRGDPKLLDRLVDAAAAAGADYAKIQALYSSDLVYRPRFEDYGPTPFPLRRPFAVEHDRLSRLDLTPEIERRFVDRCARVGIGSMITVFTRAAVERLASYGFDAVKIASYDCPSYPLLREVAQAWRRVFVSTGATFDDEVPRAVEALSGTEFALLQCVTIYPTPLEHLRLERMQRLRSLAPVVGFSDHTSTERDGTLASRAALAAGADVIERHFTVLPPQETKDGPISIGPRELEELRQFADLDPRARQDELDAEWVEWRAAVGAGPAPLTAAELRNRDYYRGRVASWIGGRVVFNWEDVDLRVVEALPFVPRGEPASEGHR